MDSTQEREQTHIHGWRESQKLSDQSSKVMEEEQTAPTAKSALEQQNTYEDYPEGEDETRRPPNKDGNAP